MKAKVINIGWNILRIVGAFMTLGGIIAVAKDIYTIKASGIPEDSFAIGLITGHIIGIVIGIGLFILSERKIEAAKVKQKVKT